MENGAFLNLGVKLHCYFYVYSYLCGKEKKKRADWGFKIITWSFRRRMKILTYLKIIKFKFWNLHLECLSSTVLLKCRVHDSQQEHCNAHQWPTSVLPPSRTVNETWLSLRTSALVTLLSACCHTVCRGSGLLPVHGPWQWINKIS